MIGYSSTSTTIDSSYNKGSVSVGSKNVGGLVGYAYKSTSITSSYNTGSIKVQNNGEKYVNAGGLIGNNTGDLNIKKSYNTGTVNGYKGSAVGGIIGNAYQYGGNTSLVSCYNTGNISSDSYLVGGYMQVRPSFYLNASSSYFYGGNGSKTNPYIINS